MNTSGADLEVPRAEAVTVTQDTLFMELNDGRTISAPLAWFPRFLHATLDERNKWRLIGKGHRIHWENLDEDISVEGLLAGKPSGESQVSFKKWLNHVLGGREPRCHGAPADAVNRAAEGSR